MHLPSLEKWLLIGSIFLVLIIGFLIWLFLFLKSNKLRKQIVNETVKKNIDGANKVIERTDHGEVNHVLKNTLNSKADDLNIEFIINTIIKNNYKNAFYIGNIDLYEVIKIFKSAKLENIFVEAITLEQKSILKNAKIKNVISKKNIEVNEQFDLLLISNDQKNLKAKFDKYWAHLKTQGLLIITNVNKKNKDQKELLRYIKLLGLRHEIIKLSKSFILVAK